jgi:hypothetical protein
MLMLSSKSTGLGVLLLAASFVLSAPAICADNGKTVGEGPNPFVDCGIGAALFPETPWAAVSSNVIWDVGTTAVISATASPETCSAKKVQAAMFIGNTYEKLAEETATGQGEHLTTVLNLFDCTPEQHASTIQALRGAMGREVSSESYMSQSRLEQASNYYFIIENIANHSCSV